MSGAFAKSKASEYVKARKELAAVESKLERIGKALDEARVEAQEAYDADTKDLVAQRDEVQTRINAIQKKHQEALLEETKDLREKNVEAAQERVKLDKRVRRLADLNLGFDEASADDLDPAQPEKPAPKRRR